MLVGVLLALGGCEGASAEPTAPGGPWIHVGGDEYVRVVDVDVKGHPVTCVVHTGGGISCNWTPQ